MNRQSKKQQAKTMTPSLLEDESRGGDIGEGGIAFQSAVTLSYILQWLRMEGFTSLVRESIGDTEAKFFVPGHGFKKECVEVKNHLVTPTEFWAEIGRFMNVDAGAPGEYQWFALASAGLSPKLHPLVNSLRRLRDPYDFYEDSVVLDLSYQDYVRVVAQQRKPTAVADFLYRKVLIIHDLSPHSTYPKAIFKERFRQYLPHYQDLPDHVLEGIYDSLATFVQSRRNQTITRTELEAKIQEKVPPNLRVPVQPIRIHTTISDEEKDTDRTELLLRWARFFGGAAREFPPPESWNSQMLSELQGTKDWIVHHRSTRRLVLSGNRRLSASLAIGATFSAVSGFAIEMTYRDGARWATDTHATDDTPDYPLTVRGSSSHLTGDRIAVSVSIIHDIADEVNSDLEQHKLKGLPTLHIRGEHPVDSPQQANLIVRRVKHLISEALSRTGAQQIDLFFAGPAFVALFLGHRLNATAQVQCYERVRPGCYVPTCLLFG